MAAIAAAISAGVTLATTGASFIQAHNRKKDMQKAEKQAKKSMMAAKKKLDVNFYDALSIDMTPYERERDALLSQGKQVMETAVEGQERGAGTIAGKVMASQLKGQSGVSDRQTKQLETRQSTILDEEKRLQTEKFDLDKAEATGAQLAARDAAEARQKSLQSGITGVQNLAQQGARAVPLFGPMFGQDQMSPEELVQYYVGIGDFDAANSVTGGTGDSTVNTGGDI